MCVEEHLYVHEGRNVTCVTSQRPVMRKHGQGCSGSDANICGAR